ncbi:cytoplasmic glycerophosphodiester phosphodiesterase [Sphingobacterium mizutaii]|uniref:Cytoplasmic glycerophosphodiester phosphodiesterase n=2 Tax=Sphingobacterium mizutaii TaxID=1010 RepID=A0AAJ5C1E2_9SPHI|nr:glycerophosphodiester phosphodiesterase family protein [Sphingobacterium mizutaii]SDL32209.1 glycerophosphoryl diester phosphodiesterase [Sphingobacterium mizutaii]SNV54982.1 cytoplasmic glycerophosphodiester phosphodiesterase [Sphingobacterium mizutaii]
MSNRVYSSIFIAFMLAVLSSSCFRTNSSGSINNMPQVDQVFNLKTVDDLYHFLTYNENSYPLVSAHRGGPSDGFPENAIPTFAEVASKMPAIIECDIAMTKDSVLVLMHDETLDRTTTGKGKLSRKTFEELKELKLKDNNGVVTNYRIPTLEDALQWGIGRVIYTLDVKKSVPYEKVIELIRKTKAEANSIIITYSANQAEVVNRLAPDLMISATIKNTDDLNRLSEMSIPDTRLIAFVGTREPDTALYTLLRQHGIKSILGTIGNLDRSAERAGYQLYADFIVRGADVLSTDRPFEAYKALDFYIKKRNLESPFIN